MFESQVFLDLTVSLDHLVKGVPQERVDHKAHQDCLALSAHLD